MLTRHQPWGRLHRPEPEPGPEPGSGAAEGGWTPAVDVREETERFVIAADVPGVDPADIDVWMENGVLTIRGERKRDGADGEGLRRAERRHGSFSRRFALPDTVDPEGIAAAGRNGVLEVVIPKRAAVQPRRIKVAA